MIANLNIIARVSYRCDSWVDSQPFRKLLLPTLFLSSIFFPALGYEQQPLASTSGKIFDRLPFPRRSRTKVRNRFVLQIFSRPACTLTTNQGPKIWLLGKELKFVHEILYEEIFTIPTYLRLLRSDGRVLMLLRLKDHHPYRALVI